MAAREGLLTFMKEKPSLGAWLVATPVAGVVAAPVEGPVATSSAGLVATTSSDSTSTKYPDTDMANERTETKQYNAAGKYAATLLRDGYARTSASDSPGAPADNHAERPRIIGGVANNTKHQLISKTDFVHEAAAASEAAFLNLTSNIGACRRN